LTTPPLKAGRNFETVVENSLALTRAGLSKGQAMAAALNFAGYRPPTPQEQQAASQKPTPSVTPTKPSTVVH
jgi:hypothetical protein